MQDNSNYKSSNHQEIYGYAGLTLFIGLQVLVADVCINYQQGFCNTRLFLAHHRNKSVIFDVLCNSLVILWRAVVTLSSSFTNAQKGLRMSVATLFVTVNSEWQLIKSQKVWISCSRLYRSFSNSTRKL
jgi:hypothetical protein